MERWLLYLNRQTLSIVLANVKGNNWAGMERQLFRLEGLCSPTDGVAPQHP